MTAESVLKPSVFVSTMVDNLPVTVTGKSIWNMSGKMHFEAFKWAIIGKTHIKVVETLTVAESGS